jgi:hypothetical protein
MQLLAPDILAHTREVSPLALVVVFVVGAGLWMFGGRTHRFWLALCVTVAAGIIGLGVSRDFGVQPLVSALLLALSAGSLALALARVAVFAAGGIAAIALARSIAHGWNDFLCFLAGGLAGVTLFPLWVAALSSAAGTALMAYSLISLMDQWLHLDSRAWAEANAPLINWSLGAVALLGVAAQQALERLNGRGKAQPRKEKPVKEEPVTLPVPLPPEPPPAKKPWWGLPALFGNRKAA